MHWVTSAHLLFLRVTACDLGRKYGRNWWDGQMFETVSVTDTSIVGGAADIALRAVGLYELRGMSLYSMEWNETPTASIGAPSPLESWRILQKRLFHYKCWNWKQVGRSWLTPFKKLRITRLRLIVKNIQACLQTNIIWKKNTNTIQNTDQFQDGRWSRTSTGSTWRAVDNHRRYNKRQSDDNHIGHEEMNWNYAETRSTPWL